MQNTQNVYNMNLGFFARERIWSLSEQIYHGRESHAALRAKRPCLFNAVHQKVADHRISRE